MNAQFERFYDDREYRHYKRHLFNYRLRRSKIGPFLKRARGPILDIGCGIAPMALDRMQVFLSDMSFESMRIMRADGYRTAVLDIEALGLQSGSLSTIVCSEVLEHVDDDRKALREMHRALAPDGRLILTVPLHRYYWHVDDELVGHRRRYNPDALARDLRATGFEVLRSVKIGSPLERYLTLAAVLVFLRGGRSRLPPRMDGSRMRAFSIANGLVARVLDLATVFTPRSLNSIVLLYCRKARATPVDRP